MHHEEDELRWCVPQQRKRRRSPVTVSKDDAGCATPCNVMLFDV